MWKGAKNNQLVSLLSLIRLFEQNRYGEISLGDRKIGNRVIRVVDVPVNAGNSKGGFLFVSEIWVWLTVTLQNKILGTIFFFMETFFDFFKGTDIFTRALSEFFSRIEKKISWEN